VKLSEKREKQFWAAVDQRGDDQCWEWQRCTTGVGRYGAFRVSGKQRGTHRIAWELTHGPIPSGLWVLHHCDNPPCCNPSHLYLGTAADNAHDREKRNRSLTGEHHPNSGKVFTQPTPAQRARGERHGSSKLNENAVCEMRKLHSEGRLVADIARRFNVSWNTAAKVVKRENWRHVV
jgi:hypothetical protein